MEVKVSHINGVRFAIQARSHVILSDQPIENGGEDTGMTPPEFLLASLGSCAAYYAVDYLKKQKLAQNGVEVSVTAEKFLKPARMDKFRIQVMSPVPLTPEHSDGMVRAIERCLVHNTFLSSPEIKIELTSVVAQ